MFAFHVIMRSNTYVCPQNTVVVERWWQVPLSKVGSPPRLHPRRHRIYKLVEDTKRSPTLKMELILTQTVPSESLKQSQKCWDFYQQTTFRCLFCLIKITVFILLTELGGRGDTVIVKKSVGRNKLLPQGLAVYPSPENKEMFAEELRVCMCVQHLNIAGYVVFTVA